MTFHKAFSFFRTLGQPYKRQYLDMFCFTCYVGHIGINSNSSFCHKKKTPEGFYILGNVRRAQCYNVISREQMVKYQIGIRG